MNTHGPFEEPFGGGAATTNVPSPPEEKWQDRPLPPPEPKAEGASDDIRIALLNAMREEQRKKMVWLDDIKMIFRRANFIVLASIVAITIVDYVFLFLGYIKPEDRIVTEKVILALVAATVAQVGAITLVIWKSWFPTRDEEKIQRNVSTRKAGRQ